MPDTKRNELAPVLAEIIATIREAESLITPSDEDILLDRHESPPRQ